VSPSLASRAATSLRLRALDLRDRFDPTGPGPDPFVPPRRMQFVGVGDFAGVGDEFFGHFTALAGLTPGTRVLDVGSGIGRIARPLVGFLGAQGSYDGFDPDPEGVRWCQHAYRDVPRFTFAHVDVFNKRYNPAGTVDPATLRFPYDDGRFDLVVMVSVLTHLLPETLDNYLRESARVLAPGGRLCATAFLLDETSRAAIAAQATPLPFGPERDGCAVVNPEIPEDAVAYDAGAFTARLADAGLHEPEIHPGTWADRPSGRTFQDLVVARKGDGGAGGFPAPS